MTDLVQLALITGNKKMSRYRHIIMRNTSTVNKQEPTSLQSQVKVIFKFSYRPKNVKQLAVMRI